VEIGVTLAIIAVIVLIAFLVSRGGG